MVNSSKIKIFAALVLLFAGNAGAFQLLPFYWHDGPSTTMHANFNYNQGRSPSGTTWNDAFQDAVDQWNFNTVFRFDIEHKRVDPCKDFPGYEGEPVEGGDPFFRRDGKNGVGFDDTFCGEPWGPGTLAVTTFSFADFQFTRIHEADVIFNKESFWIERDVSWDVYSGPWKIDWNDFRRVAVHELGHVAGLDHDDSEPAIMNTYANVGDTIEGPMADDIAGIAALYIPIIQEVDPIIMNLEVPGPGSVVTGVGVIQGWAATQFGLERVENWVDGDYKGNIPTGGNRKDVVAAFPNYPDADTSGFAIIWNYNNFTEGEHTITIKAIDKLGNSREHSRTFTVMHFPDSFISDPNEVSLDGADITYAGSKIFIKGMTVTGAKFNVDLDWDTASQNYRIVNMSPAD